MSNLGSGNYGSDVTLSPGQQKALLAILNAEPGSFNFITGKAGSGKSTVLRELRKARPILVAAPTGLAAINVGGQSIHSLFRLPIGPLTRGRVKGIGYEDAKRIFERCHAIVIDEISMVRADLLDGIDWCLRKTLDCPLPFGGKAVIAFGDMWQLEPVVQDDDRKWIEHNYRSPFWFDAKVFNPDQGTLDQERAEIVTHELTEVFRQSDQRFVDALNLIRLGDPAGLAVVNERKNARWGLPAPVTLTYTNQKAVAINAERLAALPASSQTFTAVVDGDFGKDLPGPVSLSLKVGAQVMVTRNMQSEYGYIANGEVGEIVGFHRSLPVVELRDGRLITMEWASWEKNRYVFDIEKNELVQEPVGEFSQIPLKLAWAVTTHKSQGQTLDSAILELERTSWTHGLLYVALSRVRGLDGLFLKRGLSASDLIVSPRVREFCGMGAFKMEAVK